MPIVNYEEIDREIARLESEPTTYASCERLAILYNVRNNAKERRLTRPEAHRVQQEYSFAPAPANASEFVLACSSVPAEDAFRILDAHMDAVRVLYPKEYDAVLRKLRSI